MSSDKKSGSPKLARWLLNRMIVYRDRHSIFADFEETFLEISAIKGRSAAKRWFWANTLKSIPKYLGVVLIWRLVMVRNYLKIAYRNLLRQKLFSFINVFGLSVGLSICIIIFLWVRQELSYDRFHENSGRLYRVERRIFRENLYSRWPITGGAYKQALLDDYPEFEDAARLWRLTYPVKDHRNTLHEQNLCAVDNSFVNMFDFGLEEGDARTALSGPFKVVLTRRTASKYFGTEDALGKPLPFEWDGELVDFEVTGILKPVPRLSHIHFDMLISIDSFPEERFSNWRSNYLYTYVLLRQGASPTALEEKLKTFVHRRLEPAYLELPVAELGRPDALKMVLFPITDIHLHPSVNWEVEPGGSIDSVYIFTTIAVFILILACINFINLSTARAGKRAKEVGLRKTIGAGTRQLRAQFVQESILSALLSLVLALVLCSLLIPLGNAVFGLDLSIRCLLRPGYMFLLVGITAAVGILSGLYPAFHLARFDPIRVLRGSPGRGSGRSIFRTNMVIFQFLVSTLLIIGMFVVYRQMHFIQTRSLGFEKDNLIIIPAGSRQIPQGYDSFRSELLSHTRIVSVSASFDLPGDAIFSNGDFYTREGSEKFIDLIRIRCGFDYVDNLKLEILAGRGFSREFGTDAGNAILLNESAVKKIGWTVEEALGKKLDRGGPEMEFRVVGVVKDFNFKSLRKEVEPAVLQLFPEDISTVTVRMLPDDLNRTLSFIRAKWESKFPGEQFEFSFLESRLMQLYAGEINMQRIFVVFTSLSILVACLGLFGLAAFTAEMRTKEIGIRKTLGASWASIAVLLTQDFIKWILIANLLAWPAAYYLMSRWLMDFAYRTKIGWEVFVGALGILLLIALGTIFLQTLKTAFADPVASLRYE